MKSIKKLPDNYLTPIEKGGRIERIDYTTVYDKTNEVVNKYAYVYLPYGYDSSNEYDILL